MKKLVYISGEDFFDVDFPILKELNKTFDLTWIPVLRKNGWYTVEDIKAYSKETGVKATPVLQVHKYKHPMMVPFYISLLKKVKAKNADLIYFEYFGVPYLHLLSPLFLDPKKMIFAMHDVQQHYKMDFGKIKTVYFDYILKRFKNFQVFSESQLKIFNSRFTGKNVFVGNLYLKDFGKPTKKVDKSDKVNFLFFGIIRNNKGIEVIIQAFNELAKLRKDFKVTIAGSAKNWEQYEALINDKSIFDLQIRKIPNIDIPDLFNNADYALLPYKDVTQSGVLLTSYNYNVPVIASNFPGFREYVVDGYNGYLIEPDAKSLAEKATAILDTHSQDKETIRTNLKDFVHKNININNIAKQYNEFLQNF